MWIYLQRTGQFRRNDEVPVVGYSGFGAMKNDPLSQQLKGMGPIPQGAYNVGDAFDDPEKGPVVMHLIPCTGTETFGRSGFLIHGDNKTSTASHGCIILPRPVRERVAASHDRLLVVLSGNT